MVKDLDLKKTVVECDLHSKLRSLSRKLYIEYGKEERDIPSLQIAYAVLEDFENSLDHDVLRVCKNLNRSFYRRRKKVMERVEYMVRNGNCLFLTFTFTDDVLNRTNAKYRRNLVSRYLAKYECLYLANIDFGVKDEYIDKFGVSRKGTHREHYHAIILCEEVDYTDWFYMVGKKKIPYGTINGKKVRQVEDSQAIATYITKLTNHAVKSSTMSTFS